MFNSDRHVWEEEVVMVVVVGVTLVLRVTWLHGNMAVW